MDSEREFFLFDGPGGAMGIGFFFWRRDLFFARKREKKFGVFLCVFLCVFARGMQKNVHGTYVG